MRIGRKYIIHLEAFVASIMHAYKWYVFCLFLSFFLFL